MNYRQFHIPAIYCLLQLLTHGHFRDNSEQVSLHQGLLQSKTESIYDIRCNDVRDIFLLKY
jgi:hypothetical protein